MNDGNRIWLELRFMGRVGLFRLEDGGQPLCVGSGWCTDVHIEDARVAFVHFELACVDRAIWLIPRTPDVVRLNTARACEPRRLTARSMIEFLEYEIEVVLHSRQPPNDWLRSRDGSADAGRSPGKSCPGTAELPART